MPPSLKSRNPEATGKLESEQSVNNINNFPTSHKRLLKQFEELCAVTVPCEICGRPRKGDTRESLRQSIMEGRERVIYEPCNCDSRN